MAITFFYFLISGGNELPYYYLMHGLNIILHIRLNPQPLTKRSYKTTLCMCESCQVIFRNNILYREIERSRKGTSYAHALRMSVSGAVRIQYKYSHRWNAVLCNNRRTRSEQQQSSRSEQKKRFSSENV